MSTQQACIKTEALVKSYGKRIITNHVNLEIHERDFTVIMGSSGSGKSTLLYLLSGLETPDDGAVMIGKVNMAGLSEKEVAHFRRKTVGFVFQAMHLVPTISVLDNITVPGRLLPHQTQALKARAHALLEKFDVDDHAFKYPSQLSGGEQQRVAIARALINKPTFLFADEPTGALNSHQSNNVLDVLTTIHQEKQGVVMVTHDIKAAARATRLLFLKDGQLDGELSLPPFEHHRNSERENTIFNFLKEKGW